MREAASRNGRIVEPDGLQLDIERFLFWEAELLDNRRFEEWLALFTDDADYSVPNDAVDFDPGEAGALIWEDKKGLVARVRRLQHPAALTQTPVPKTQHFITNVVVQQGPEGDVSVRSYQLLYYTRRGREKQLPGSCEYVLQWNGDEWRIRRKKVYLINADQALSNLPIL